MTENPTQSVPADGGHSSTTSFTRLRSSGYHRDTDGRWFGGVCTGLAQRFGVDPVLIRAAAVVLAFLGGIGLTAYVILWLLLPDRQGDILAEQGRAPGRCRADRAARARRLPPCRWGLLDRQRQRLVRAAVADPGRRDHLARAEAGAANRGTRCSSPSAERWVPLRRPLRHPLHPHLAPPAPAPLGATFPREAMSTPTPTYAAPPMASAPRRGPAPPSAGGQPGAYRGPQPGTYGGPPAPGRPARTAAGPPRPPAAPDRPAPPPRPACARPGPAPSSAWSRSASRWSASASARPWTTRSASRAARPPWAS